MRRRCCLLLILVAACAQSNEAYVAILEERAIREPDAEADRIIAEQVQFVAAERPRRTFEMDLLDDRMPTVTGRVNGVEMPLILDSGASLVSLSGRAAEATRLYLPPGRESRAISPGFDAVYRVGVFDSILLDDQRFGRGIAVVPMRDRVGGRYGIVGCSVLGQFKVTFDFRRRKVRLEPNGEGAPPLFVTVKIHGRPYRLLVDSGATRLFVEPRVARELGLITDREVAAHQKKSETFRAGRVTQIRLKSVEVAGRTFTDISAGVVHTFAKGRADGLLGLAGFGKLVWILDFKARIVRIRG